MLWPRRDVRGAQHCRGSPRPHPRCVLRLPRAPHGHLLQRPERQGERGAAGPGAGRVSRRQACAAYRAAGRGGARARARPAGDPGRCRALGPGGFRPRYLLCLCLCLCVRALTRVNTGTPLSTRCCGRENIPDCCACFVYSAENLYLLKYFRKKLLLRNVAPIICICPGKKVKCQ